MTLVAVGWERCLGCLALSLAQDSTHPPAPGRGHGTGTWDRLEPRPHAAPARRFIKSERSIILLNFCVSILASNVLILVGQSQMLSKVGATTVPPSRGPRVGEGAVAGSKPSFPSRSPRPCWLPAADWIWINSISGLNPLRQRF